MLGGGCSADLTAFLETFFAGAGAGGKAGIFSAEGGAVDGGDGVGARAARANGSGRYTGRAVFGGFEIAVAKGLTITAEAQYRRVPNALGAGGVSKDFNETDLGGVTARVSIGFSTKR